MAQVELTSHLYQFFPALQGQRIDVPGSTVAEVVEALEALAPGLAFYLCDERGRLRQQVNIYVGNERMRDRSTLTDPVPDGAKVPIFQALSGG